MFFVLPNKKRFTDHSFLKLTSGYVNQTQADDFTCTIVSISFVPWFAGAIEWSLGVIAPSVFITAIICSVALIYVWKIIPVNLKVLVREKININAEIPQSGRLIIETVYKHCLCDNKHFFVLKLAANLLCINKKGTAYI